MAFSIVQTTGLFQRLAPFVAAEVLSHSDLHIVDLLAMRVGVTDVDVLLGLALAVRAPRFGHVGVDLTTVHDSVWREMSHGDAASRDRISNLPWPPDTRQWRDRVFECEKLVGVHSKEPHTPFVVEASLVMPRRYSGYLSGLSEALCRRLDGGQPPVGGRHRVEPATPVDCELLRVGLDQLFGTGDASTLDLQRLGAAVAVLQPLTVLSGGPGTGKTYTIKKVLVLLRDQWRQIHGRDPEVALAAPTGRAAVRMVQAIGEDLDKLSISPECREWLGGLQAHTLHRLLGFNPRNSTRFRHDETNPLPHEIIVVDESSMVDLAMMAKLFAAVRQGTRLILLGDRNQLASVEAGRVLADITASVGPQGIRFSPEFQDQLQKVGCNVPLVSDQKQSPLADCVVHFVRPYRVEPGSGLQALAAAIAGGTEEELASVAEWVRGHAWRGRGPFSDLTHIPHAGDRLSGAAVDLMCAGYRPVLELLRNGCPEDHDLEQFHLRVLSLLGRFRVLTAHRRGVFGVDGLNAVICDGLLDLAGAPDAWWVGRPVMVTQNSYEIGRMNGDVGVVVPAPSNDLRVAFAGAQVGTIDYVDIARLPAHETVFAMTVHKSQGCQFDHVVMVIPPTRAALLTRELVYTGLTRARRHLTVLGDPEVLGQAVRHVLQRASTLRGRLWPDQVQQ